MATWLMMVVVASDHNGQTVREFMVVVVVRIFPQEHEFCNMNQAF